MATRPTKRRSPAKTPPRSQKSSKPSPAAVSRSPASSKARSPPKRAPPPRPPPSPVPSSRSSARPARLRDEARQLAELVQATATVVEKRRTLATARLEAARAKRPASPAWRGPSPSPTRPPLDRTRLAYAPSPPTKNRPKTRGRSRKDAQRAAAAALDRARSSLQARGATPASGIDFSRLFPRGITLDADEFRSGVRRVLKVAPSTLSDADIRRVFRSVESEDAVALDGAQLAFVDARYITAPSLFVLARSHTSRCTNISRSLYAFLFCGLGGVSHVADSSAAGAGRGGQHGRPLLAEASRVPPGFGLGPTRA